MLVKKRVLKMHNVLEGLFAVLYERGLESLSLEDGKVARALEKSLPLIKKIAKERGLRLSYNPHKIQPDQYVNEALQDHIAYQESPPNFGLHIYLGNRNTETILNGDREMYEHLADEFESRYKV
jgi:hypothetical protein